MRIFGDDEMQRRLALVTEGLRTRDLEVAFLHTADNVYYMTGVPLLSAWGRPMWAVVWADGRTAVVGAMIERESLETYSWADDVRTYDDAEDVWAASLGLVLDIVKSRAPRLERIGVERAFLPVNLHESLDAKLAAQQVDITDVLFDARLIKGPEEVELLRLGGEIAKVGANAFLEALQPGVTELAIAGHAVAEMDRALGALRPDAATSSYAYCQLGPHSLTPHLHPTGRRLQRGDIVALNVFPVVWGYCMELERTYIYGEPNAAQREALAAVNESFALAKAQVRPGKLMRELDQEASEVLRHRGYGAFIRHGTGHAHGIMIGAAGREGGGELRTYNPGTLRAGMVNSIEPGIYIPDLGGFRHSDVVLVTESGSTLLTEFPTSLNL